jgi:hypothetical protein
MWPTAVIDGGTAELKLVTWSSLGLFREDYWMLPAGIHEQMNRSPVKFRLSQREWPLCVKSDSPMAIKSSTIYSIGGSIEGYLACYELPTWVKSRSEAGWATILDRRQNKAGWDNFLNMITRGVKSSWLFLVEEKASNLSASFGYVISIIAVNNSTCFDENRLMRVSPSHKVSA